MPETPKNRFLSEDLPGEPDYEGYEQRSRAAQIMGGILDAMEASGDTESNRYSRIVAIHQTLQDEVRRYAEEERIPLPPQDPGEPQ